ncbi:zeta-sarcoglycan-like [Panulirus ornatus]|uniref:zeta-sarcoglycan-like n=1 Tax=Panulirus ornatus TaxID=150431 RepID=UPI003A89A4CE
MTTSCPKKYPGLDAVGALHRLYLICPVMDAVASNAMLTGRFTRLQHLKRQIISDITREGMGGLQIVRGGLIASGDVHVMDTLVATRILSRPHTPIRILAANNFSISATDASGRLTNSIFLNSEAMECTSDRLVIRDKEGRLLFSATRDEVLVGARHLTVKGEGGAVFSGSVQTAHVTAPVREALLLESLTRSLEVTAPQGVALESRAGTITASCLHDFTLQSTGGVVSHQHTQ